MGEISVIIVSWNACGYLRDCLRSLRETGGDLLKEIIVVDNASRDGSPEMVAGEFPGVILIQTGENLGFARANNLGIKRASGSLLALINSDVKVWPGCLQALSAAMEQKSDVGLMGPRTFGRDGNIQLTCGRLPTIWNTFCQFLALDRVANRWPLFAGFQLGINEHERSREVEVLSGCFWLARRRAISEVGLLDERFFFYAEDVDWCKRFRDARWKLWFVAEAQATHYGGGSSGNATLRFTIEILRANLLYWKKHHGQKGRAAYWALAMAQHCLRLIARGAVELSSSHANEKTKQKLEEHKVCVRWLLTGKGV